MSGVELEIPQTMDATPEPEEQVQPQGERPLTPRERIMADINAKREAQIERDNAQAAIYDRDATDAGLNFPDDEPESAPRTPEPPPAVSVPPKDRSSVAAPAPAPQQPTVRFVEVDGYRYPVTPEQEVELIRLGMHANQALHQYQAPSAATPQPAAPPRPIVDPDMVRDTVRKMQFSGEDDAAAALTELITGVVSRVPQAPQIDPNTIISRAVAESRAQAQLVSDAAVIRQEFDDIFAHPQRELLAKLNVDAIRQRNVSTGHRQSDLDIYREAGNAVREAMGLPRPGSETNQPALQAPSGNVVPIRGEVLERKRAAPRATQAIDMRSPAPVAPRAPSGSEIVDRMRQQRGQASMR